MKHVKNYSPNYNGFSEGDIINVKDGWLDNMELEIIKLKDDNYAGLVVLKVVNSNIGINNTNQNLLKLKKDKIMSDYGLAILQYATLVKKGNGIPSSIYKAKSKVSKYLLEVEDFSLSNETWKKELYQNDGINIGITVWMKNGKYVSDQDPCDELPEIEELDLGEIQLDENGFVGLTSDLSVEDIKDTLKNNGFNLK